jgi:hypothetical protein
LPPVDPTTPAAPVDSNDAPEKTEEKTVDETEGPLDQPTEDQDDNDSTDPDLERRNRRRGFQRGGFNRFRFFNFFDSSIETQVDVPETSQLNRFGRWFSFQVVRVFR